MRKQQQGFTLIEIAIVLVIIGLLLGGVLKGQELIQNVHNCLFRDRRWFKASRCRSRQAG